MVFLRHTSAGMQFPARVPDDMNVAPGIAAVLTSVEAAGGTDSGLGAIPLKSKGPEFVDRTSQKSQSVSCANPVVSSDHTSKIGMDSPLVVPSGNTWTTYVAWWWEASLSGEAAGRGSCRGADSATLGRSQSSVVNWQSTYLSNTWIRGTSC